MTSERRLIAVSEEEAKVLRGMLGLEQGMDGVAMDPDEFDCLRALADRYSTGLTEKEAGTLKRGPHRRGDFGGVRDCPACLALSKLRAAFTQEQPDA